MAESIRVRTKRVGERYEVSAFVHLLRGSSFRRVSAEVPFTYEPGSAATFGPAKKRAAASAIKALKNKLALVLARREAKR